MIVLHNVNTAYPSFDTLKQQWQCPENLNIPTDYLFWVSLPGSLTEALRSRSDLFNVNLTEEKVIQSGWPVDDQYKNDDCFSRKVLLMNGQEPWVAAHTLIPHSSLNNGLSALTSLAKRPLGELLFADPSMRKTSLEACQHCCGWGRRARYILRDQPLLVSEFFLPGLITHERKRTASLY